MVQHSANNFALYQWWLHGTSRLKLKPAYAAEAIDPDDEEYMDGYDEFTREGTQHEMGPPAYYVVRNLVTIFCTSDFVELSVQCREHSWPV